MAKRWEYMQVTVWRDFNTAGVPVSVYLAEPNATEWTETTQEHANVVFNRLGAAGWEMFAAPTVFSIVRSIPALTEKLSPTHADASDWYQRDFWLRRELS